MLGVVELLRLDRRIDDEVRNGRWLMLEQRGGWWTRVYVIIDLRGLHLQLALGLPLAISQLGFLSPRITSVILDQLVVFGLQLGILILKLLHMELNLLDLLH